MRVLFGFLVLGILLSGFSVRAGSAGESPPLKGYISIGDNIVVLPDRLQKGDRIIVTTVDGSPIFDRTVLETSTRHADLKAENGTYSLWVIRDGASTKEIAVTLNTAALR